MPVIMSASEYANHPRTAARAALGGPVFVAEDHGPSHVLLSYARYRLIMGHDRRLAESMAVPGFDALTLDWSRDVSSPTPADFG